MSEFLDRFDTLAVRFSGSTAKTCRALGMSRSLFYELKSGNRPITSKVWRKLEEAEKGVGIEQGHFVSRETKSNREEKGILVSHETERKESDAREWSDAIDAAMARLGIAPADLAEQLQRSAEALRVTMADIKAIGERIGRWPPPDEDLRKPPWMVLNEWKQIELTSSLAKIVELRFFGDVAAGKPAGCLDFEDTISVPGGWDPESHFVVRVAGRSMEPDFPDGTRIVCRRLRDGEFAKKNDLVICQDGDGAYFKKLVYTKDGPKTDTPRKPRPHLVSLNPEFPEVVPLSELPIRAVFVAKVSD